MVCTLKNRQQGLEKVLTHSHSEQHYSQQPKSGSNPNVHHWKMGKQNVVQPYVCSALNREEVLIPAPPWMDLMT